MAWFVDMVYGYLATRRGMVYGWVALLTAALLANLPRLHLDHDVKSLMPDRGGSFRQEFDLFSYAPFARNIMISLECEADDPDGRERLLKTADRLKEALKPPFITQAVCGIDQQEILRMYRWLFDRLPCLLTEPDLALLEAKLTPAALRGQLEANLRILHSPESTVMKSFVREDPLALRDLLLGKLKSLNMINMSTESDGYFLSGDGRHLLIVAETPIAMTDFEGGRRLLEYLESVIGRQVPHDVGCRVICGHRYTVANAQTIQKDLVWVLTISVLGLGIVFFLFMRHWQAIWVMFLPVGSLLAGITILVFTHPTVSAITIGFGAILLGMSADYGLHVYYGIRGNRDQTRSTLKHLVAPLSFCALTTVGVFSVLLFSALPVQRQLSLFCMAGIVSAYLFALLLLPHLVQGGPRITDRPAITGRKRSWTAVWIWVVVLTAGGLFAGRVRVDCNLRAIGMVPEPVLRDEIEIKKVWGGVREVAMIFSLAGEMQTAMEQNDRVFAHLRDRYPQTGLISSAAVLPAAATQRANLARWQAFWERDDRRNELAKQMQETGKDLGYAQAAFGPFLASLTAAPLPFTLDEFLRDNPTDMIAPLFIDEAGRQGVITLITDSDPDLLDALSGPLQPSVIVSNLKFSQELNRETTSDFIRFFLSAIGVVLVLLVCLYRNAIKVLLCGIPVVTGVTVMLGTMGALGMSLNLINMVAAILIVGLAVDYGIFVVSSRHETVRPPVRRAILVSGLTTFVGFGSLMIARHPALSSLGFTVAAGIVPAMLVSLLVMPTLTDWLDKPNAKEGSR